MTAEAEAQALTRIRALVQDVADALSIDRALEDDDATVTP
jgi:hypothetical protein